MVGTVPPPDEQPRVSKAAYRMGWILWFGIPAALAVVEILLIISGWPAYIVFIFLPFIVGLPAVALAMRRYGANLIRWDEERILLQYAHGERRVAWNDIEWFWKLWVTHKLKGGGKAWIATLLKYRTGPPSRSTTVLLTVSGGAGEESLYQPLSPRKYRTVFDLKVPSKDHAAGTQGDR